MFKNKLQNENSRIQIPYFEKYAIIQTGGKQYQALEGKTLAVEKLDVEPGQKVVFDKVLLRKLDDNNVKIGQPYLDSVVNAIVIKHDKGPKLIAFKMKRRKKSRRKIGHRQPHTVVRIESI